MTIDCADLACACECHREDAEYPKGHLPTCSWVDPAYMASSDPAVAPRCTHAGCSGLAAVACGWLGRSGLGSFEIKKLEALLRLVAIVETKRLQARLAYAREKFEDIVEDAEILAGHADPKLHDMILGIKAVAENQVRAMVETEPNGADKEGVTEK